MPGFEGSKWSENPIHESTKFVTSVGFYEGSEVTQDIGDKYILGMQTQCLQQVE